MAFMIVGIGLLILCGVLLLFRRSQDGRLFQIRTAESCSAQGLSDAAGYVAERLGEAGSFSRIAQVNGVVKCDSPLTSEVARQPCVYYEMSVVREYEEVRLKVRRRNRLKVRGARRSSERVATNSQRVPFCLEDATGRILVNPDHAEMDLVKTVERFEPSPNGGLDDLLPRGFGLDVEKHARGVVSGSRTLGYRFTERLLPVDQRVHVVGEARDASGQLAMERPREKGKKLIVSLKSQEELIASAESALRWLLVGAAASGISGAGLVVAGLLR
ncbi:MAG: E3 ubiquitin ligase family protein [Chloroflexi bacterium]|nr:E3 ubiquitin ligase family protein [Chloroflexota bacterium]